VRIKSISSKSIQRMKIALIVIILLGIGVDVYAEDASGQENEIATEVTPGDHASEDSAALQEGYLSREDLEKQAWIRIRQNRRPPLGSNQPTETPLSESPTGSKQAINPE